MATWWMSRFGGVCRVLSTKQGLGLRAPSISLIRASRFTSDTSSAVTASETESNGAPSSEDATSESSKEDVTASRAVIRGKECRNAKEAQTNLLDFLNQSDIQKRKDRAEIPFFTAGSYLAVTRSDPYSYTGETKFVGICIARRNKGLGSNFVLRNVIDGMAVEMTFELYSPMIKEIQVLKLERRRRAKLYYLRDKPLKYSTVSENMVPVKSDKIAKYKRERGAPA